jgi:uncharacterized membrane protein (UPF0127 family)
VRRRGTQTLRREDGRIVCEKVVVADRTWLRLKGLLGRRSLPAGEGIVLRPGFSIHTAFMRFPIDAVFLDQDLVVLKISAPLRPFHTASCRGAREVVELSAGECARRGLAVGDRVAWASQATVLDTPVGAPVVPVEPEIRGRVALASRDARFVKLTRFLLDGKGIESGTSVPPEKLIDVVETDDDLDAVILDAQDAVAQALATANAARALRPDVSILIVGEGEASQRAPVGVRIYDKWNETDDLLDAIETILKDRQLDE